MRRFVTAATLLIAACSANPPASPLPDMTSGTPYCAGMALWELPDYAVRLAAPSGAIVTAGGADTSGMIDVTLKTLGTPDEIAAFYRCALPYIGHDSVAPLPGPLPGGERGFSYAGPGGRQGQVVLRAYDLPFPDDGWDTFIRITETQR